MTWVEQAFRPAIRDIPRNVILSEREEAHATERESKDPYPASAAVPLPPFPPKHPAPPYNSAVPHFGNSAIPYPATPQQFRTSLFLATDNWQLITAPHRHRSTTSNHTSFVVSLAKLFAHSRCVHHFSPNATGSRAAAMLNPYCGSSWRKVSKARRLW